MIRRKAPIKRNIPLKRYTSVSNIRRKTDKKYPRTKNEYLTDNPVCATQLLAENDPESYTVLLRICEKKASTIHHQDGREDEKLNDTTTILGLCAMCHQYIQVNSATGWKLHYYI